MAAYLNLSYWMSSVDDDLSPRAGLPGDRDVDVAIVGAGYTGLWTAYYLAAADPTLRIAVLEQQIAGYGASGRNGGWCSALFPKSSTALARRYGRDAAVALYRAMVSTVDEVGRVADTEGIACSFAKGGTVALARTPVQFERARAEVDEAAALGLDGLVLLGAAEARARCGATGVLGGTYTPHCAAIHPAALVRGLARAVERRGVTIYERTPVLRLRPGPPRPEVVTPAGVLRAEVVVRATEGYTAGLPGYERTLAPVYSLMVATAPLAESVWDAIGLAERETFTDYRHLIIYGQRTSDGRLAFGGRGAPYHYGSGVRPAYDRSPRVFGLLREALADLFPGHDLPVEYSWGGPLGVPRDWCASVGLDRARGLAWGGGYVGDGVGTSNLAGRTLADLIRGERSELTALPWVGHRSPRWAPEPLRWLAVNTALRLMTAADAEEARTGRASRRAALFSRLLG
jgi:glycine/D-amino acid oxidase-like deaminating enzyme